MQQTFQSNLGAFTLELLRNKISNIKNKNYFGLQITNNEKKL